MITGYMIAAIWILVVLALSIWMFRPMR